MDHRNPPSSQLLLPDSGATTYTDSVTEADQKTARNNERRNFSGFSSMSGKGPEPAVAGLAGPLGGLVRRGKSMDLDEYFVRYFLRNSKISASADWSCRVDR
jgi:hypothetical protein